MESYQGTRIRCSEVQFVKSILVITQKEKGLIHRPFDFFREEETRW